MSSDEIEASLGRLDQLTRRLRAECPWDREQTERTIVPHTVEEAYELADAANSGDDAGLVDELGDVLFQVYFLSLLLEERGVSNLGEVADRGRDIDAGIERAVIATRGQRDLLRLAGDDVGVIPSANRQCCSTCCSSSS